MRVASRTHTYAKWYGNYTHLKRIIQCFEYTYIFANLLHTYSLQTESEMHNALEGHACVYFTNEIYTGSIKEYAFVNTKELPYERATKEDGR